jgi:hypothetical protein
MLHAHATGQCYKWIYCATENSLTSTIYNICLRVTCVIPFASGKGLEKIMVSLGRLVALMPGHGYVINAGLSSRSPFSYGMYWIMSVGY